MRLFSTSLTCAAAMIGAASLAVAADPDWARPKIDDDVNLGFKIAPVPLTIGNRKTYQDMSDSDLTALYSCLRSIPALPNND